MEIGKWGGRKNSFNGEDAEEAENAEEGGKAERGGMAKGGSGFGGGLGRRGWGRGGRWLRGRCGGGSVGRMLRRIFDGDEFGQDLGLDGPVAGFPSCARLGPHQEVADIG